MIGIPDPDPLQTDFDGPEYDGGIIQDELTLTAADGTEGTIKLGIGGSDDYTVVTGISWDFPIEQILWTTVYWSRARHVEDGYVSIMSKHDELPRYRLGGLYRIADFDLWDSEKQ